MVRDHIRTKCRTYLEKCELDSGENNLWRTIKILTNRKTQESNAAISLGGTIISDNKKAANQFNRQFTSRRVIKDKRQLHRHLQELPHSSMQFTEEEVNLAICSTKNSKAFGPYNIAPIMLNI